MAKEKDQTLREEPVDWLPLLFKIAGIPDELIEPQVLKSDLAITDEQITDTIFEVFDVNRRKVRLFHVEYQADYDSDMRNRMYLYHGRILSVHNKVAKQFLVNLMERPWAGNNGLEEEDVSYRFNIIDLCNISSEAFLISDNPMLLIFAVLGATHNRTEVVKQIVERFKQLGLSSLEFQKYLTKLEVFATYRRVVLETIIDPNSMRYIKKLTESEMAEMAHHTGLIDGKKEGLAEGLAEGLTEGRINSALAMIHKGWKTEDVIALLDFSPSETERLLKVLEQNDKQTKS